MIPRYSLPIDVRVNSNELTRLTKALNELLHLDGELEVSRDGGENGFRPNGTPGYITEVREHQLTWVDFPEDPSFWSSLNEDADKLIHDLMWRLYQGRLKKRARPSRNLQAIEATIEQFANLKDIYPGVSDTACMETVYVFLLELGKCYFLPETTVGEAWDVLMVYPEKNT